MSAFPRLWKRAPLWRLCLYSTVFFSALAAFYPTPYLLRAMPFLSRAAFHTPTPPPQPQNGQQQGTDQNAPPAPDSPSPDRAALPALDQSVTNSVPFAGHALPLPAGVWHPALTAQTGPQGDVLTNMFIRTDRGIITGVVIAHAGTRPVHDDGVLNLQNSCHDDRNLLSRATDANGISECWFTTVAVFHNGSISPDPLVTKAFERLHVLGFPIAPMLVGTGWTHIAQQKDGGFNFETVDTLLSPTQPGTTKLIAPMDYWDKLNLPASPPAQRFVNATNRWMESWATILHRGLTNPLPPGSIPAAIGTDPAAPPA